MCNKYIHQKNFIEFLVRAFCSGDTVDLEDLYYEISNADYLNKKDRDLLLYLLYCLLKNL